jgi:hypothetical protein
VGQDGAILRSYEWLVSKERNGGRSEPEMSFGRCYSHLRDVVNHMEGTRGSFPPVLRLVLLLRTPSGRRPNARETSVRRDSLSV